MKQATTFILLSILSLTKLTVFGQADCDTIKYTKLLSNSYQCKWTFFTLNDTIEGVIVKHERQTSCGGIATASLSIVKIDRDTIRVLDLCNIEDYKVGQRVKIIPGAEPKFQVHIPSYIIITGYRKRKMTKQEKKEQKKITKKELSLWRANDYDERILKTTWVQLINE
jgi:hypothetical protein